MSLFDTILEKLGIGTHATPSADAAPAPQADTAPDATSGAAATSVSPVDVKARLDSLASQSAEHLNWKTSIVDLLKLLKIDSSPEHRKQLAKELNYTGSIEDSAAMNTWLHKAVVAKLAKHNGQVPEDLLQ